MYLDSILDNFKIFSFWNRWKMQFIINSWSILNVTHLQQKCPARCRPITYKLSVLPGIGKYHLPNTKFSFLYDNYGADIEYKPTEHFYR